MRTEGYNISFPEGAPMRLILASGEVCIVGASVRNYWCDAELVENDVHFPYFRIVGCGMTMEIPMLCCDHVEKHRKAPRDLAQS